MIPFSFYATLLEYDMVEDQVELSDYLDNLIEFAKMIVDVLAEDQNQQ